LVPINLYKPEWFLKNIVDKELMNEFVDEVLSKRYRSQLEEIVYRAHHMSYKVFQSDYFFYDFRNYIVRACGLKKGFWNYLPDDSAVKYMYAKRKNFKLRLKRRGLTEFPWGDVTWSLDYYLSQAVFWYYTNRAFARVWKNVVLRGKNIPMIVDWSEGITLYLIDDFIKCFSKGRDKCVKKTHYEKYKEYMVIEELENKKVREQYMKESGWPKEHFE